MYVKFSGSCLKQDKVTFNHKTVKIYIVYDLKSTVSDFDPTLINCLFGAVKLTKIVTLINISIVGMELDLIQKELLHIPMVELV